MSEGGSSISFRSFWKHSVDKKPPKQITFLPPNQSNDTPDNSEASGLTKDQLRRVQVKRAQSEHRKRKKNYAKYLEQDIIDLRLAITATHDDAASIQAENESIKNAIQSRRNADTRIIPGTMTAAQPLEAWPMPVQKSAQSQDQEKTYQELDSGFGMSVSINFDEAIKAACLQTSYFPKNGPETSIDTPTMFSFPATAFAHRGIATNTSHPITKPPQHNRPPSDQEVAQIAINFILALEHPCRTHFHAIPTDFNPKGPPTNHEMLASTSLYAHAPNYVFEDLSCGAWDMPSCPTVELQKLKAMNESLPKEDSEITPVQAWFLLTERFELDILIGREKEGKNVLERLKGELATLVDCYGFGAAMSSFIFWGAVELFT